MKRLGKQITPRPDVMLEPMQQTRHVHWKGEEGEQNGSQEQDAQNSITGCVSAAAQHLN